MPSPGPQVGDDMVVDLALSVLIGVRVGHLLVRDEDAHAPGVVVLTRSSLSAPAGDPFPASL
ncbi:hypothetical protein [Streptomyces sp. NPDC015125]|uniref:hypothetical protein n=1 Tax=Streptomyces sp. NPDC015125 TaxID=3364938 RepID=UPI0036FC66FC